MFGEMHFFVESTTFDWILDCLNKKHLKMKTCSYICSISKKGGINVLGLERHKGTPKSSILFRGALKCGLRICWRSSYTVTMDNTSSPFALNAPPVKIPKSDNTFPWISALWGKFSTSACKLYRCWRWRWFFRFHLWCFIRGTFITYSSQTPSDATNIMQTIQSIQLQHTLTVLAVKV